MFAIKVSNKFSILKNPVFFLKPEFILFVNLGYEMYFVHEFLFIEMEFELSHCLLSTLEGSMSDLYLT